MHRVTVTDQHYDMVRQYMVATKLPHVRAAVERMIEIAAEEAVEEGNGSLPECRKRSQQPKRNAGARDRPDAVAHGVDISTPSFYFTVTKPSPRVREGGSGGNE